MPGCLLDCLTGFARCQWFAQVAFDQCLRNTLDCCGLLRLSDKELKSWGYRDNEQPARFKGACGDRSGAEAAEMRLRTRERTRQREAAAAAAAAEQPVTYKV